MKFRLGRKGVSFIPQTQTIVTVNNSNVTVPVGARQVVIDCYGAGGGYATNGKSYFRGGGGGQFSRRTIAVAGGDILACFVPPSSGNFTAGATCTVKRGGTTLCAATGGLSNAVQQAQTTSGCVGDFSRTGGFGSNNNNGYTNGGCGGGCAGPNANGSDAILGTSNGYAGPGQFNSPGFGGGGLAGDGGSGGTPGNPFASAPTLYGGGGSSAQSSGGYNGAQGVIQLSFT